MLMLIIARVRAKPDWILRINELGSCMKEGRDQVRRALEELREAGLIHQEKVRRDGRMVWTSPVLAQGVDPHGGYPAAESQPVNNNRSSNNLTYMIEKGEVMAKPSPPHTTHEEEREYPCEIMLFRLETLASRLKNLAPSNREGCLAQYTASSPIREDQHSSFSIGLDSRTLRIVFTDHGFTGTKKDLFDRVVAWSGEAPGYFFAPGSGEGATIFTYRNEEGRPLARKIKNVSAKEFRWEHYRDGTWTLGKGGHRVLYQLPEVLSAVKEGRTVFIVEGEKDVESLRRIGQTATTPMDGAGSWSEDFNPIFDGADVAIIADCDDTGQRHARIVYHHLEKARTRRLFITGVGKDISDHLGAGESLDDLIPLSPEL